MTELQDNKSEGLEEFTKEVDEEENLAKMVAEELEEEKDEPDQSRQQLTENPAAGASGVVEGY